MRYILSLGLLLYSVTAASQAPRPGSAFRIYGSGEQTPLISNNPAAFGRTDRLSVSVYAVKTFMLVPELTLSAGIPTKSGAFGFGIDHKGGQLHTETEAAFAYGRKLSDNITAGLGFGFLRSRIPGYLNGREAHVAGGMLFRLTPELVTGMNIRKRIGLMPDEKLKGEIYHAGLGYTVSDVLLVAAELEKEEGHPALFRTGLEYHFKKELHASIGFAAATGTWSFGSGARFPAYTIESVISFHPSLGLTPSVTIVFQKRKKQK